MGAWELQQVQFDDAVGTTLLNHVQASADKCLGKGLRSGAGSLHLLNAIGSRSRE